MTLRLDLAAELPFSKLHVYYLALLSRLYYERTSDKRHIFLSLYGLEEEPSKRVT